MKHEPVAMVWVRKDSRKYKHVLRKGITYWNHWFNVYQCPLCKREASHKARPIICRGKEEEGSDVPARRGQE